MTPHTGSHTLAGPPSTGAAPLGARPVARSAAHAAPPHASVPGPRPRGRPRKRSAGGGSDSSPGVVPALTGAAGVTLAATASSGWDVLEPLFTTTVATAVLTSVIVTAWPVLSPPRGKPPSPRRRRAQQQLPPAVEEDGDGDIVYGAASVVSCIPFTNWVAWAGLALLADGDKSSGRQQAETRAGRYAAFAVVYALPYLHCGLELDSLAVFSLLVGIAHMQLEFALQRDGGNGSDGGNGGDDLQASISDWLSTWTQTPNSRQMQQPRNALGPPKARPAPARRSAGDTPDAALDAEPRSSSPSVARQLGERVGELTAQLATLRTDFAAGKADGQLRVSLLAQEQDAQAELEALRATSAEEIGQWDDQYRLRAATRVQLLQLARSQRIVGASRLSKRELVDALEASMVVHGQLLAQQDEEGKTDAERRSAD